MGDRVHIGVEVLDMPGRGELAGLTVQLPCAFCRGTGRDPFGILSWLSTCCVCLGQGTVWAPAPYVRCRYCQGSGAVKTFTCTVCGGKGVVAAFPGPTVVCPQCRGTGNDAASGLACLPCRGRGRVPQGAGGGHPG